MFWIRKIFIRIRIRGPVSIITDPDPAPDPDPDPYRFKCEVFKNVPNFLPTVHFLVCFIESNYICTLFIGVNDCYFTKIFNIGTYLQ